MEIEKRNAESVLENVERMCNYLGRISGPLLF